MNQYREGKVKRTPRRGVKKYLKSCAYKRWEQAASFKLQASSEKSFNKIQIEDIEMYDSMKDLQVFQKAYQLSLVIHQRSLRFPGMEQWELVGLKQSLKPEA